MKFETLKNPDRKQTSVTDSSVSITDNADGNPQLNTTSMLEAYIKSGTKQILCNFTADFGLFRAIREVCENHQPTQA